MSKGHSEDVINISLSTNSILGDELKRVPTWSVPFLLLYHMGKEFQLVPDRKIFREFWGWGSTHENSRGLSISLGAKLHETFI